MYILFYWTHFLTYELLKRKLFVLYIMKKYESCQRIQGNARNADGQGK